MTDKQRRFVEAYAGNATEAARVAGYRGDANALAVRGHRLLRSPVVAAAIRERSRQSRGDVLGELSVLDDRARCFVEHFVRHGDPADAARTAGYRPGDERGPGLLSEPSIAAAVEALRAQRQRERDTMDREERERLLAGIARDETASPKDRIAAVVALGRMQGDFTERIEHSGEVGGTRVIIWRGNGRGPEPQS